MRKNILFYLFLLLPIYSFSQVNLNAGLVAYYPFTGNANDQSGNGNNPSVVNATLTADHFNNPNSAYYFDGQSSYIQIPNSSSLSIAGPMTIYAYVKPMGFYYGSCHGNCVVDKGNSDGTNSNTSVRFDDRLYTNSANCNNTNVDTIHEDFYGIRASTGSPALGGYTPYVTKNQWYCLVMVQDNATLSFYVNSVLVGTVSNPISGITTNSDPLMIGRKNDASFPYWFNGVIDEVRIYNRALNIQEVDSLCGLNNVVVNQPTIINKYAAVQSRGTCDNIFNVDTATGFNVGDTVLMIQMKGATIDSSNTASFGTVTSYHNCGNYETNVIKAKTGNAITLKYKVARTYDIPNGKVQFVRVPYYQNYTVSQQHTAMLWTGTKGGIFAVNVAGTLTLNDKIDVSGKGFAGGVGNLIYSGTEVCGISSYYTNGPNIDTSGQKGEGIADVSAGKSAGRGHLANGGGGGNAHNGGGGGGGNGGTGGVGGWQHQVCNNPNPPVTNISGGLGGVALSYSAANNKIFLGGGGGAGHANNSAGTTGGNGGGLVFIKATTINNSATGGIIANGADGNACSVTNPTLQTNCNDGMGGGGGGGTVVLQSGSYTGATLPVQYKGGRGADETYALSTSVVGPGAGGGGGILWVSQATVPAAISASTAGGANGIVTVTNDPYGAQPGLAGTFLTGLQLIFPVDTFRTNSIAVNFTDSIVSCIIRKLINTTTTTSTGAASYIWDAGVAGTSTQRSPTFTFPGNGIYPVKLIVVDSNGCRDSIIKNVTIDAGRFASAGADVQGCIGGRVTLHASGGIIYSWSPTAGLSNPNAASTTDTVSGAGSFVVTVTNSLGCIDRDTVNVLLVPGQPISASPADTSICRNGHVQLHASGGVSYIWSPALGLSNPLIANPVASPVISTLYYVTGTDTAGCKNKDSIMVNILPGPVLSITTSGDGISCYQRSVTLYGHGAASYVWHPGIYCNDSTLASPAVTPPRTTVFTVVGTDLKGCTSEDTINVIAAVEAVVFMPNAFTPNNDGKNDKIYPIIYCDFNFEGFYVYNRWGQQVFYTPTYQSPWDGTFNGTPCELGVYHYFVKGHKDNGEPVIVKGNITLIR